MIYSGTNELGRKVSGDGDVRQESKEIDTYVLKKGILDPLFLFLQAWPGLKRAKLQGRV